MHACAFSGGQCQREATVTLRIFGVGDRAICTTHHEWMVANGMNCRVLEPGAHVPPWRQRDLRRDMQGVR